MRLMVVTTMAAAAWVATFSSAHADEIGDVSYFESERDRSRWTVTGTAGFDLDRGLAFESFGNAWIRASSGWNAMAKTLFWTALSDFVTKPKCRAELRVRSSGNVSNFYFSAVDAGSEYILWERGPLGGKALTSTQDDGYKLISEKFAINPDKIPKYVTGVRIRFGFWGNGQDAWVQVDNVAVICNLRGDSYPPSIESPNAGPIVPCGPPDCILDIP